MRAAGLVWDAGVLQAEQKFQTRSVVETLPLSHKGQKGSKRILDPILSQWFMSKELYRCN